MQLVLPSPQRSPGCDWNHDQRDWSHLARAAQRRIPSVVARAAEPERRRQSIARGSREPPNRDLSEPRVAAEELPVILLLAQRWRVPVTALRPPEALPRRPAPRPLPGLRPSGPESAAGKHCIWRLTRRDPV